MTEDDLRHLSRLATITAGLFQSADQFDEWKQWVREVDDLALKDHFQCLSILAEAFVALSSRTGMTPTFRIPARSQFQPKEAQDA